MPKNQSGINGYIELLKLIKKFCFRHPVVPIGIFFFAWVLIFLLLMEYVNRSTKENERIQSAPVVEDAWEARLRREQEEWNKKVEKEINSSPSSQASTPGISSEDKQTNKISSIILSVACGAKVGVVSRGQMGETVKQMLTSEGIDPTSVYEKWDYYWGRAKEMDEYNKSYCIK